MKKKFLFFIIFITLICSGCTTQMKNENGEVVKNPKTGQTLTENILCQPESNELISLYEENGIDFEKEKIKKCENFSPFDKYENLWTSVFVKPIAWVIIKIGSYLKSYGLAIIIVTLLIRCIMIPITQKTAMQSENLKKIKPQLDRIEKKYQNKKDQDSQQLKAQETMAIYKQNNINPLSGCLFSLIQIPLFFAFFEAMNRLPILFEEKLGPFSLGTTVYTAVITQGKYYYIIFSILVITATYFSFKLNKGASMTGDQEKQMSTFTNMMVAMIAVSSMFVSTAISIYWIVNSSFTIIQNLLVKRSKKNDKSIKIRS